MHHFAPIVLLGLTAWLGGCAAPSARQPLPPADATALQARDIRGTFVSARPGLLVIYTFLPEGGGLATIDTEFRQATPEPPFESPSAPDEEVVTLVPTIAFTWKLTPPNVLTIDLPWPAEAPTSHFLRVERAADGKLRLHEMESPDGPDLDIEFHFDHDLIVEN